MRKSFPCHNARMLHSYSVDNLDQFCLIVYFVMHLLHGPCCYHWLFYSHIHIFGSALSKPLFRVIGGCNYITELYMHYGFIKIGPRGAISHHWTRSTPAQVMAWTIQVTVTCHYLNSCWLLVSVVILAFTWEQLKFREMLKISITGMNLKITYLKNTVASLRGVG